jgi:hypothetical protein
LVAAYVAGPHEWRMSAADEEAEVAVVVETEDVKAVVAVVDIDHDDDDACGDLALPPPTPRAWDLSVEMRELSSLVPRQVQPTSTTTGGCRRGSSNLPLPPRRSQPTPASDMVAFWLVSRSLLAVRRCHTISLTP